MFGFLVPFFVGLNGCTSRLFTSNFLRHSKNVSSMRCGENLKNCMGKWWRFSRIPRPSKSVKFQPLGLFLVVFRVPNFRSFKDSGFRHTYVCIYIYCFMASCDAFHIHCLQNKWWTVSCWDLKFPSFKWCCLCGWSRGLVGDQGPCGSRKVRIHSSTPLVGCYCEGPRCEVLLSKNA